MIEPGKIYEIDLGIMGRREDRRGHFFTLDDVLVINGHLLSIKMRRVNFDKMNLSNKDVFIFDPERILQFTYTSNDKCQEYAVIDGAVCSVLSKEMQDKRAMREFDRLIRGHVHQPQQPQAARVGYMWNPFTGREELVQRSTPVLNPYTGQLTYRRPPQRSRR